MERSNGHWVAHDVNCARFAIFDVPDQPDCQTLFKPRPKRE